jgi:membrane-bound lytic murein transglycosylase D
MRPLIKLWAVIITLVFAGCSTVPGPQATAPSEAELSDTVTAPAGLQPLKRTLPHGDAVTAVVLPRDLWERIRRGFAMPDLDNELVNDRVQWYAQRPEYILRMTERSRKYLYHIVEEIEQRGMPTELALLPFVESAFNPQAVSSAKATGMWQFMPATGRDFDLKQNAFRDDRRDVQASTRAALDYLQRLYNLFGDWHLALASYNWGEGSVGRAIARNQKAGLATGYTDLSMPMETRFYVPKLQAIKNIIARPELYAVKLPDIPNHPYFQTVPLPRDMDVTVAAKLAEITVEDFRSLNPSAHRPVLLAAGTPQILLPWDNAEIFQRNYEAFGGGRLASWTAWVAPSTMKTAEAAKRAGMSELEFRQLNDIPPRKLVRAGAVVLIPRKGADEPDVAPNIADNGQLSLDSEPVEVKHAKGKKAHAKAGTGPSQKTGKATVTAQAKSGNAADKAQAPRAKAQVKPSSGHQAVAVK